jgi:alanyl-tRNA synthetase
VSEGSVSASLSRIEAVTSYDALEYVYGEEQVLARLQDMLKARTPELAGKVSALQERVKEAASLARRARADALDTGALETIDTAGGYPARIGRIDGLDSEAMRTAADAARGTDGAVVLFSVDDQKVLLLASGSPVAVAAGFDAGAIIKALAPLIGGGGGGRPAMAQAGGRNVAGVDAAMAQARQLLSAG